MELEYDSVELVGAGLGGDNDLAARLAPKLGRVGAGEHAELADGVKDGAVERLVGSFVVIVDAVEQILVGDLAVSSHIEAAAEAQVRPLRWCVNVRLQLRELKVVLTVQWKFDNLLLIDDVADGGILARYERGSSADVDFLGERTRLE